MCDPVPIHFNSPTGLLAFLGQFCPSASDTNPVSLLTLSEMQDIPGEWLRFRGITSVVKGDYIRPDQTAMRWLLILPFSFFIANESNFIIAEIFCVTFYKGGSE